jgi:uncharacterized protein YraI
MNLRSRPARLVAAVGAVVAAGTTTFMAVTAGTASADEPGRCTENVNVREEPDATSPIVALCEAGTQVMLGAEQDGWVRLDDQGGWASKDFVKADENAAGSSVEGGLTDGSASRSSETSAEHSADADESDRDSRSSRSGSGSSSGSSSDGGSGSDLGDEDDLGGLLG